MKIRRLLSAGFAVGIAAASLCSFPVAADTPYTRISYAQMVQYIGNTVDGYYLSNTGTLKPITFNLSGYDSYYITSVDMSNTTSPNATTLAPNSYVVLYSCSRPADIYTGSESYLPVYIVDWNLHFSNVEYIGFETLTYVNNVYFTLDWSYLSNYNSLIAGSSSASLIPLAMSASSNNAGRTHVSGNWNNDDRFSGTWAFYEGNPTDYYIGSCQYSNVYQGYSYDYVCISCPVINQGFHFVDRSEPPAPVDPPSPGDSSYSGSGSGSGSIGSESSDGSRDFDFNFDFSIPDYSGAINPSYDSSVLDTMDSDISGYHADESALIDAANSGLDSLPDLEFDSSLIDDAENPLQSFFGINIIGIMIFWVGAIAFISYILFGKWV